MSSQRECKGVSKWELDTPCLLVDLDILEQNIRVMQTHATAFGKQLRPHAKTHRCSRIARKQTEAGCAGICISKVGEAEVLVKNGFQGVLITSPVVTDHKIARLMECLSQDSNLLVVVDHPSNVMKLNEAAKERGLTLNVLVDLDPGMGRTGVPFKEGVRMGQLVASLPSLRLRGLQCYAGNVQHISSFEARTRASLDWMEQAAEVFHQFHGAGLPCDIFTGAGTGTYEIDCKIPEITDLQVGSYTLMDAEYLEIGCSQNPTHFEKFPPALTLLATVISMNHPGFVTIDAGLKALYRDGGSPYVLHPPGSDLRYEWHGDEHGKIIVQNASKRPEIGDIVELVVSHCDPTVNLYDALYVTRKGVVEDVWPIDMRGKSQ